MLTRYHYGGTSHYIVHIRHHTGVVSKWCRGIIPVIQTNLMSEATPNEVTIWTDTVARDYGTTGEVPLPTFPPSVPLQQLVLTLVVMHIREDPG